MCPMCSSTPMCSDVCEQMVTQIVVIPLLQCLQVFPAELLMYQHAIWLRVNPCCSPAYMDRVQSIYG